MQRPEGGTFLFREFTVTGHRSGAIGGQMQVHAGAQREQLPRQRHAQRGNKPDANDRHEPVPAEESAGDRQREPSDAGKGDLSAVAGPEEPLGDMPGGERPMGTVERGVGGERGVESLHGREDHGGGRAGSDQNAQPQPECGEVDRLDGSTERRHARMVSGSNGLQLGVIGRPPLSMALCALRTRDGGEARAQIESVAAAGYRWVQLDAAAPGVRARELSRSARRDLAALLRRCELGLSGLDLWIPEEHFALPEHADRAVAATMQAIALAADLATLTASRGRVVSIRLPQAIADGVERSLLDAAQRFDVRIADHAFPVREPASSDSPLGVGVDPAAVMMAGEDPAAITARIGGRLAGPRLNDLDSAGGRVTPGHGRLDVEAYLAATSVAAWNGPLVVDLRGLTSSAERAMIEVLGEWGMST